MGEGEGRRREEQKLDLQVVVCINELLSLAPATESSGNHNCFEIGSRKEYTLSSLVLSDFYDLGEWLDYL